MSGYKPAQPVPPALLKALADAQGTLYRWAQAREGLAHLNNPNQVTVAQVNSEIIVAQAGVDKARNDTKPVIHPLPAEE